MSSDFSENQVFTDYESSQSLLGNSEAQVSAARFYVENPKEMDGLMKQVENLSLGNQGYQVGEGKQGFGTNQRLSSNFPNLPDHLPLWDVDSRSRCLDFWSCLWLRERVYEVGILLALGKRQKLNLPTVLFRGSFGIAWSFASSICCRKRHHIYLLKLY